MLTTWLPCAVLALIIIVSSYCDWSINTYITTLYIGIILVDYNCICCYKQCMLWQEDIIIGQIDYITWGKLCKISKSNGTDDDCHYFVKCKFYIDNERNEHYRLFNLKWRKCFHPVKSSVYFFKDLLMVKDLEIW